MIDQFLPNQIPSLKVYSIGIERLRISRFMNYLKSKKVRYVIDLRGKPTNRQKDSPYNYYILSKELKKKKIEYFPKSVFSVPIHTWELFLKYRDYSLLETQYLVVLEKNKENVFDFFRKCPNGFCFLGYFKNPKLNTQNILKRFLNKHEKEMGKKIVFVQLNEEISY